jgi:hypothetical protein
MAFLTALFRGETAKDGDAAHSLAMWKPSPVSRLSLTTEHDETHLLERTLCSQKRDLALRCWSICPV